MNYLNPKISVLETSDKGKGLFAKEKISKDEIIDVLKDYQILSKEALLKLPKKWRQLCYEISSKEEICPKDIDNPSPSFLINHSCNPNVGSKQDYFTMVAMRDIKKGEELTYDYVMTDAGNYDMECFCGSKNCRKRVTGTDWMIPEIQNRYKGYFQKNIQDKIDAENKNADF